MITYTCTDNPNQMPEQAWDPDFLGLIKEGDVESGKYRGEFADKCVLQCSQLHDARGDPCLTPPA